MYFICIKIHNNSADRNLTINYPQVKSAARNQLKSLFLWHNMWLVLTEAPLQLQGCWCNRQPWGMLLTNQWMSKKNVVEQSVNALPSLNCSALNESQLCLHLLSCPGSLCSACCFLLCLLCCCLLLCLMLCSTGAGAPCCSHLLSCHPLPPSTAS